MCKTGNFCSYLISAVFCSQHWTAKCQDKFSIHVHNGILLFTDKYSHAFRLCHLSLYRSGNMSAVAFGDFLKDSIFFYFCGPLSWA